MAAEKRKVFMQMRLHGRSFCSLHVFGVTRTIQSCIRGGIGASGMLNGLWLVGSAEMLAGIKVSKALPTKNWLAGKGKSNA